MPRSNRLLIKNGIYHVFNRGIGRKYIQFSDTFHYVFLDHLVVSLKKYKVELYAYCLMNNHYHLLLKTPHQNLDKFMQYFGAGISRKINHLLGSDGALFRSRYRAILVNSQIYLIQLLKYIHLNPVAAGLVKRPEQYLLSSYQAYLKENPEHWILTSEMKKLFTSQVAFEQFHEVPVSPEIQKIFSKRRLPQSLD